MMGASPLELALRPPIRFRFLAPPLLSSEHRLPRTRPLEKELPVEKVEGKSPCE
jgi:hypothetical protein